MTDNVKREEDLGGLFCIHDQYIKDVSFENPNYLMKYDQSIQGAQPDVSINVETNVAKFSDVNYEVSLDIKISSVLNGSTSFILEMVYAGLVSVVENLDESLLEPTLLVHCPFLLFPFARGIVATLTSSGGYSPLMIEPIDFSSLYLSKRKEMEASRN
ncbi:MAG: protein-export chaperone SecB [Holosporales bacterium]|nr:protein-export chaperone SecB [Holosporales bacterium]